MKCVVPYFTAEREEKIDWSVFFGEEWAAQSFVFCTRLICSLINVVNMSNWDKNLEGGTWVKRQTLGRYIHITKGLLKSCDS